MEVYSRYPTWTKLYEFQRVAVAKVNPLGGEPKESALIADDMGLGKTWTGIARDRELRLSCPEHRGPVTLIVAPSGTHWNTWVATIRQYAPGATYWVIDRKKRGLLEFNLNSAERGEIPFPDYVIVHYEALRLMSQLRQTNWFHIMCDEVHRVKNRKAQMTRALKAIPTRFKTGLSGTPADDKPQDFWSVLNWLWPRTFRSYWKFVNECCTFEDENLQKAKYGRTFKKIEGVNPDGVKLMLDAIRPAYVRRSKEQVGIELPEKTYSERHVQLPPGQRRAYNEMRKDMIAWVGEHQNEPLAAGAVVAQLVRLQQFALATVAFEDEYVQLHPAKDVAGRHYDAHHGMKRKVTLVDPSVKLDELEEIVEGNPDESLVVFSQSRSMSHLAVRRLQARGIEARPYTGSVPQADRDLYEAEFQKGNIQVLCGTIAAGGEGITLHRASTVVFFDRHWSPSKNKQAENRVHRIGQVHPVQIIDIIADDTVDLGRNQRIANKWEQLLWILGDKVPENVKEAYANAQ